MRTRLQAPDRLVSPQKLSELHFRRVGTRFDTFIYSSELPRFGDFQAPGPHVLTMYIMCAHASHLPLE